MNNLNKLINWLGKAAANGLVLMLVAFGASAQDATVTTITHGESTYKTDVKDAQIVYVEGNDLVLKLEDGRVEHIVVPDSDRFTIDGKEISVHELEAGTKLTQTIVTSTTPRYVNSVRTLEGKIWHVTPPTSVLVQLPDNSVQQYTLPNHSTFSIDGKKMTSFDLRKGMKIKATIVTDEEQTVVEHNKFAFGQAPKPATPQEVGILLFRESRQPEVTVASAETPADMLPETGSSLPLLGLMGTLTFATALGMRAVRRARS